MKKMPAIALATLLAAALLLAGCGGDAAASQAASSPHAEVSLPAGDVLEITEKLFIAQTNDIYLNYADYLGKRVRYEGLYKNTEDWDDDIDEVLHYVVRYGPGCCGYDAEAGFEVRWGGEWPQPDDWVEVEGTLRVQEYASGYKVLYVETDALTVKAERGAEYVSA